MRRITFLAFLFCFCFQSYGQQNVNQRTCGTDHSMENLDPIIVQKRQSVINSLNYKSLPACSTPLIIPVAVHYGAPITADNPQCLIDAALAQVEQLNLDFASCNSNAGEFCEWISAGCTNLTTAEGVNYPVGGVAGVDAYPIDGACIKFCLADQNLPYGEDIIGGYAITVGDYIFDTEATDTWAGYLNFFVSSSLTAGLTSDPLGKVNMIGDGMTPDGNGVFVRHDVFGSTTFTPDCISGGSVGDNLIFNKGATGTHEVGHYFGLQHTFGEMPAIADTPFQLYANYGCAMVDINTCEVSGCNSRNQFINGNPPILDLMGNVIDCFGGYSGNFMDYVHDECMFTFTEDQIQVMQAIAAAQNLWSTESVSCNDSYISCVQQAPCPFADIPYSGVAEHCAADGAYVLPTDFSSVIMPSGFTALSYIWVTSDGIELTGIDYAVNPSSACELLEVLHLKATVVDADGLVSSVANVGALELTVYPDPANVTVDDLITFEDGDCDGPSFIITPTCQIHVSVSPTTSSPDFPVSFGSSGTVNYNVILDYSIFQEERNLTDILIPDNDPTNPGCSEVTIPNSDIITDVIVGLDVRHQQVGNLVITLESPAGTAITLADRPGFPATATGCNRNRMFVTFDDEATATAIDFENTCQSFLFPAIEGSYQPIDPLSTFAGEDAAGTWRLCVADVDAPANTSSNINSFKLTVGKRSPCPGATFPATADYSCNLFSVFYNNIIDMFGLGDPCECNGDETYTNGIPNDVGSFIETIYLGTPDGMPLTDVSATYGFTVVSVAANPAASGSVTPALPVGTTLTWDDDADGIPGDGLGYYIVIFDHASNSGYQVMIDVTLNSDGSVLESLTIGNQCAYPVFALSDDTIEDNICADGSQPDPDDSDVTLMLTSIAGGNISVDVVSTNTVDPEDGSTTTTFTMVTTEDDGNLGAAPNNGADGPIYPSTIDCPIDIDLPFTVIENNVCGTLTLFGLDLLNSGTGDPCICNGDETYTNGIPNDVGSFNETIYLGTPGGLPVADESATYDFTAVSVTSNPAASGSTAPALPVGTTLTWDDAADGTPGDGLGFYIVVFDHASNSGYQVTIDVTLDSDGSLVESLSIGNQCAYPVFALLDDTIEDNICADGSQPDSDDPDVTVTLTNTTGGNISPNVVSTSTIDPEGGSGTLTFSMVTTEDDGNLGIAPNNGADGPAYPSTVGCPVDMELPLTVVENDICAEVPEIPTLSEWGLIILGLLTLIIGIVSIRQEEKVTA